jgi:phosphoribosylformylglycinamidine synthase
VADNEREQFDAVLERFGLLALAKTVATLNSSNRICLANNGEQLFAESRGELQQTWAEVSYRMQAERDNPATAKQQFAGILDDDDPGLNPSVTFDLAQDIVAPMIATGVRPEVAILREQGVNSHNEMAAAFYRAGFNPVDVHMSDILAGRRTLLFHSQARDAFQAFFERDDTFVLGVCNGCQMLASLQDIIPGSDHWPHFVRNISEQFEARLSLVEVADSPSVLLSGMSGARLPIVSSHGEGRAEFTSDKSRKAFVSAGLVPLRYVDNYGNATESYPANPNGSPEGIAGGCSADGRVTMLMPHPERTHRTVQHSWHPEEWGEDGPWMRMFRNARVWVN